MPPYSLAALEWSIGKRLAVPGYEVQTIAADIYARYDQGGPVGRPWCSMPGAGDVSRPWQ